MTDKLREAAEQAVIEWSTNPGSVRMASLMIHLRDALAEQDAEQKPAAWIREDTAITTDAYQASCWRDAHTVTPLYAYSPRPVAEQGDAEPVAWANIDTKGNIRTHTDNKRSSWANTPIYLHPPRRDWRGLTERERLDIRTEWNCKPQRSYADLMDMTAAALKERNT